MNDSSLAYAPAADGCRIAYRLEGPDAAPVVAFSNSVGTTHRMWDAQAAAFSDRYRVLRFDTRGHGASSAPPGPYTIDQLGNDVLALFAAAGIERVDVFCGLSLGGLIGQWLALNAPHAVGGVALANTAPRFAPRTLWDTRIATIEREGMAPIAAGAIARWFTPEFIEREPAIVAEFRERFEALEPQGYGGCCAVLRDAETAAELPAIRVPALVIVGEKDQATPPALGEEIAAAIPGARIARLDAPHLSNVERPAEFAAALEGFITEVRSA